MGVLTGFLGSQLGRQIGGKGAFGDLLSGVGSCAGGLIPIGFEEGGEVKQTGQALVHKGEYVLPKGVKPTPAQRRAVAKGKAKRRAKATTRPATGAKVVKRKGKGKGKGKGKK